MAQGARLPNIEVPEDADEIDLKLFEHICDNDDWTYRSAAKHSGVSLETAFRRIRRIRRSDFVTAMREDLQELGPQISETIAKGIESSVYKDQAALAMRLAHGLGVLSDKQDITTTNTDMPASGDALADALRMLSPDEYDKFCKRISGDDSDST